MDAFRALVLDASYRPVLAIGWQRALILDVTGKVDVLEYYERAVRTATRAFPLPAVVRLRQYVMRGERVVALTRRNVWLRDKAKCQYCGRELTAREHTLDHVMPRSRGGRTSWQNLVSACGPCNHRKGDRTPGEAGMRLLQRPEVPRALALDRDGMITGDFPPQWWPYLKRRAS